MIKRRLLLVLFFAVFLISLLPFLGVEAITGSDQMYEVQSGMNIGEAYQWKSFYGQNMFWVFYYRINAMRYKTSSNFGVNWSSENTVTSNCGGGERFSLWYDELDNDIYYISASGHPGALYYRKGEPQTDGSITWDFAEVTVNSSSIWMNPSITLNSSGIPWITVFCTTASTYYQQVIRANDTNGQTWCAREEVMMTSATATQGWLLPLTDGKVYLCVGQCSGNPWDRARGKLWNGTSWESEETIVPDGWMSGNFSGKSWSAVNTADDFVHFVYRNMSAGQLMYTSRNMSSGSWSSQTVLDSSNIEGAGQPTISCQYKITALYVFYSNSSGFYVKAKVYGGWDQALEPFSGEGGSGCLSTFNRAYGKKIGVLKGSKFGYVDAWGVSFTFHGLIDENTGETLTSGVNVTAYFVDGTTPELFFVNGTKFKTFYSEPKYFYYHLEKERQYWLSPAETSEGGDLHFYIVDQTLTSYTISFLDLAGVLDTHPYVEAKRYVNGILRTVEKRKVDVENKITMSLINGEKYSIIIKDGVSYTFGDLLMTSTTSIQLTLKGIAFPKQTLMTSKYVRIYGLRVFDTPNGTLTITYQDLLNMTNSVKIEINYKNGTNIYTNIEYSDSFNHEWSNALNNTDYAVVCTINHQRYGVYTWKNYYPHEGFSGMPWGLDWLGTSLPFNTAYILPALLVLFAGGCFSQINAEVGAFSMVIVAVLMAYMGWLPIPGATLMTAFALTVLMALVVAKRRVEV